MTFGTKSDPYLLSQNVIQKSSQEQGKKQVDLPCTYTVHKSGFKIKT